MAEYKDYVSANGGIEGQVQPTLNSSPGVLSSAASGGSMTTGYQFPGTTSIIAAQQVLAVAGPVYSSPGNHLNNTP